MGNNVSDVVNAGFCISCGICSTNCPKKCIQLTRKGVNLIPQIDDTMCVSCGFCNKVCPTAQIADYDEQKTVESFLLADYKQMLCVRAKDPNVLAVSTSGGFITQTIINLLFDHIFDCAFLVGGDTSKEVLYTEKFHTEADIIHAAKSKYLLVSQERAAAYMIEHPSEKIIFVGTGCVMQGLNATIKLQRLARSNYLLFGLFCDKTMNYGVIDYFQDHPCSKNKKVSNLLFRTKDAGGWPGNVRIEYTDQTHADLPISERGKVKEYFMPERCLYCMDKLNRSCDIAVGDNYIPANKHIKGANSILIRTDLGESVWNRVNEKFVFHDDEREDFIKSQVLAKKKQNYEYAKIKGLYGAEKQKEVHLSDVKEYETALKKISIGLQPDVYKKINADINRRNLMRNVKRVAYLPAKVLKKFATIVKREGY